MDKYPLVAQMDTSKQVGIILRSGFALTKSPGRLTRSLRRTILFFFSFIRYISPVGATASWPPMCTGTAIGGSVLAHRVDAMTRHPRMGAAERWKVPQANLQKAKRIGNSLHSLALARRCTALESYRTLGS